MKHCFNVAVAKDVGVNAAVIFENLSFWINHNAKTGKNEREGEHWMYAAQKDIAAQFDYLSLKQTRTALDKLVEADYIKTGSFNRHGYDRTTWYSLTEKGESMSAKGESLLPEGQKDVPKKANGDDSGGATIPDIKTLIKPNIKPDLLARAEALKAQLIVS